MQILTHNRGRLSLLTMTGLLVLFFIPWQNKISTPALIQPAEQTDIYAIAAAQITDIYVKNGDSVKAGDVLLNMRAPALEHRRDVAKQELIVATAQWNRQAASQEDRQLRSIFEDTLKKKQASLTAIETELAQLKLRAPHDGRISDMPNNLHASRYINQRTRLLQISNAAKIELIGLPKDIAATRIKTGADFTFISDQAGRKTRTGYIEAITPTAEPIIMDTVLTVIGGGPIAVAENERGEAVPDIPVFRVQGHVEIISESAQILRMERGVVKIAAEPSSPAKAIWTNVLKVLLRETDF